MPKHHDTDTPLGEHPFDAGLQRHLDRGKRPLPPFGGFANTAPPTRFAQDGWADSPRSFHIDDATYEAERKRIAAMGAVMIGSLLFAMLFGVIFVCKGEEIRERLEAQLYGSQV